MAKHRMDRINEEMKKEMANILRDIKDPRMKAMVSVTAVQVTNDLKYAKIFLSVFGKDKAEEEETLAALNKAKGYIRHQLSLTLNLRNTPELKLIEDTTIDYGMRIDSLLRDVMPKGDAPAAAADAAADPTDEPNETLEEDLDALAVDALSGDEEEDENA